MKIKKNLYNTLCAYYCFFAAADFADSDLVRVTTVRLVAALELLVTHTSLWCATREDVESSVIRDWDSAVTSSVQELGAELVTFLQVIFCSFFNVHSPGNDKN